MRIVGGKWRGKKIIAPPHFETRPTSDRTRETIFNILLHNPAFGPRIIYDKAVLDLFAGTGALGLEALSRGAKTATFVENNQETLKVLYDNLKAFHLSSINVIPKDVLHLKCPQAFDLIFLDPPYHQDLVLPVLELLMMGNLLSENAVLIIEMAKDESIVLPDDLELMTDRLSGAAKILFCGLKRERK